MFSYVNPYHGKRAPVMAKNMVATSQPLATQAGLHMLQKGGNAVDAILAAAITLTVVEPTSNGIGSDAFALIWDGKSLHGLNGSGRSPRDLTFERFARNGCVPLLGWDAVTVPGAVKAWWGMSEKFGQLPFEQLFEPAIRYAADGFLVSPVTALAWKRAEQGLYQFEQFRVQFLIGNRAPKPSEIFSLLNQANALEIIAQSKSLDFYQGKMAQEMVLQSQREEGKLSIEDLASHQCEWVTPISISFCDCNVVELPPNGQGLSALIALGILDKLGLHHYGIDSVEAIHLQLEAMKVSLDYAHRHIADEQYMKFKAEEFLDDSLISQCVLQIDLNKAKKGAGIPPTEHGTVYLTAADENGMMVSFIQSNYMGFGSGVVIRDRGISLHNRGAGFNIDYNHPNCYAPNKRPYHTIIPGFLMKNNEPLMSFGVMGGPMQPQGHVQMMVRTLIYQQDPQTAIDAPRWFIDAKTNKVFVEPGLLCDQTLSGLRTRGHDITIVTDNADLFGGAQMIYRQNGFYIGGSDSRKDGLVGGF